MKLKNSGAKIFRENDILFSSEGVFGVKSVRPKQPAVVQERYKWIIGDITEVFDRNTWKLGKILEMSKNNYFVIRLVDCIQLKEFHISSLRIPNASGAHHGKQLPTSDKATRTAQQSNGKKRKAAADSSHHHMSRRAHPRNVVPASNLNGAMTDSYLHSRSQVSGDEAECSVASCSVNDPGHLYYTVYSNLRGKRRAPAAAAAFPDDAMSSCPCTSGTEEDDDVEPAAGVDVHALELKAYRSTMWALYASGPLTWEQESMLTNLRLSLNISNEEHLRQLRRLLSSSWSFMRSSPSSVHQSGQDGSCSFT